MSTGQQNLQEDSSYDPSEESLFTTTSNNFGIYCERGKTARLNIFFVEKLFYHNYLIVILTTEKMCVKSQCI